MKHLLDGKHFSGFWVYKSKTETPILTGLTFQQGDTAKDNKWTSNIHIARQMVIDAAKQASGGEKVLGEWGVSVWLEWLEKTSMMRTY